MGRQCGFWRAGLDEEIEGRDAEFAELATHRMDCQRAARESGRAQAVRWRANHERQQQIGELRWRLHHEGHGLLGDRSERPMEEEKQVSEARGPAPTPEMLRKDARLSRRRRRAAEVEVEAGDGEATPAEGSSPLGSETSSAESSDGPDLPRGDGLLKRMALRHKVPLTVRQRHVSRKRREWAKRLAVETAAGEAAAAAAALPSPLGRAAAPRGRRSSVMRKVRASMCTFLRENLVASDPPKAILNEHRVRDLEACRRVFEKYDRDGSNTLDQAELRGALADLGLRAKNQDEREKIRQVLRSVDSLDVTFEDLVGKIVPEVRRRLADLNRVRWTELFDKADADKSGTLSVEELVRILRMMGTFPGQEQVEEAVLEVMPEAAGSLRAIDGTILMDRNLLSFPQFEALCRLLQERTECQRVAQWQQLATEHELTEEQQELWRHDLVGLYESFQRFCDCSELMDRSQLACMVRDVALMPKAKGLLRSLEALVDEELGGDDVTSSLEFCQCVKIMSSLRAQECQRLQRIFEGHDADDHGGLSLAECQRALRSCDVVPRNPQESREIAALVEEFDEDGSGEVDLQEFLHLVPFVVERLRKLRHEEDRQKAFSYGWTDERYEELRSAFAAMDDSMSDSLDTKELTRAVGLMAPSWSFEEVSQLVRELDLDPANIGQVDFAGFLHLMLAIEERGRQRSVAELQGIGKETADHMSRMWRKLGPDADGLVVKDSIESMLKSSEGWNPMSQARPSVPSSGRMRRLSLLVPEGNNKVDFARFLKIMRRFDRQE